MKRISPPMRSRVINLVPALGNPSQAFERNGGGASFPLCKLRSKGSSDTCHQCPCIQSVVGYGWGRFQATAMELSGMEDAWLVHTDSRFLTSSERFPRGKWFYTGVITNDAATRITYSLEMPESTTWIASPKAGPELGSCFEIDGVEIFSSSVRGAQCDDAEVQGRAQSPCCGQMGRNRNRKHTGTIRSRGVVCSGNFSPANPGSPLRWHVSKVPTVDAVTLLPDLWGTFLPTPQSSTGITQSRPFPARAGKVMESAGHSWNGDGRTARPRAERSRAKSHGRHAVFSCGCGVAGTSPSKGKAEGAIPSPRSQFSQCADFHRWPRAVCPGRFIVGSGNLSPL